MIPPTEITGLSMTSPTKHLALRLRPISLDDASAIACLLTGDTELALQTATIPIPYTIQAARDFLRAANPHRIFAIIVGDELVGSIGMISPTGMMGPSGPNGMTGPSGPNGMTGPQQPPDQPPGKPPGQSAEEPLEIGYWIGRIHWGRGYATSALCLLIQEAQRRGISRLTAAVFPDNAASIRVLENNGFVRQGEIQRDLPQRGGLRRLLLFRRKL